MTTWKNLSVVFSILAKQIDESLDDVTRQIFRSDPATRGDSRTHLIEVGRTGVARGEVLFEAASMTTRKGAVEIVADQFNGVATHEW
jgi:hypothetical protein